MIMDRVYAARSKHAEYRRSYVVALVCPDRPALTRLATKLGKSGTAEELVEDK